MAGKALGERIGKKLGEKTDQAVEKAIEKGSDKLTKALNINDDKNKSEDKNKHGDTKKVEDKNKHEDKKKNKHEDKKKQHEDENNQNDNEEENGNHENDNQENDPENCRKCHQKLQYQMSCGTECCVWCLGYDSLTQFEIFRAGVELEPISIVIGTAVLRTDYPIRPQNSNQIPNILSLKLLQSFC